jgi:hypothetical protein
MPTANFESSLRDGETASLAVSERVGQAAVFYQDDLLLGSRAVNGPLGRVNLTWEI